LEQVQIQTIDYCNRKCQWCPNSKMEKDPATLMPVEVFKKILDDFTGFQGKFHLYLMGEPLCDPRLPELVAMVRERFQDNTIFISTNGDLLTAELLVRLFDAGLSCIGISHYDQKNDHLLRLKDERITHTTLNDLRLAFYNRAGLVNVGCIERLPKCGWLWSKAYINYRGDVVLCCSDYYYEVVFGNVMDEPFKVIWNSDRFNEYREAHLEGRGKEMHLCQTCNRIR